VDDPDRVAWLRRPHPFTLRDTDEFTCALRAAATDRGGIGGMVLSVEAAFRIADLLDDAGWLRASDQLARRLWMAEVGR